MRICSKTLDDGTILALEIYPKYPETGRFLDRILRRKVYSLSLEKMRGSIEVRISDASTGLLINGVYLSRQFYMELYNRINNERDFCDAEKSMSAMIKARGR